MSNVISPQQLINKIVEMYVLFSPRCFFKVEYMFHVDGASPFSTCGCCVGQHKPRLICGVYTWRLLSGDVVSCCLCLPAVAQTATHGTGSSRAVAAPCGPAGRRPTWLSRTAGGQDFRILATCRAGQAERYNDGCLWWWQPWLFLIVTDEFLCYISQLVWLCSNYLSAWNRQGNL